MVLELIINNFNDYTKYIFYSILTPLFFITERRRVSIRTSTTTSPHTILSPSTPRVGKGMNEECRKGNTNVSAAAQSTAKHCSGDIKKSANINFSDIITSETVDDNTKQVKSTVVRNDSVNKKDVGALNVNVTPKLR